MDVRIVRVRMHFAFEMLGLITHLFGDLVEPGCGQVIGGDAHLFESLHRPVLLGVVVIFAALVTFVMAILLPLLWFAPRLFLVSSILLATTT
jgi:hypothetical protein